MITFEHTVAGAAVVMIVFVVGFKIFAIIKVLVAVLAVIVVGVLNPVFFQTCPGVKVLVTIVADVVFVVFVLPEGALTTEIAIATITFGHIGGCTSLYGGKSLVSG